MSNIYQFIELPRVGPTKKKIHSKKSTIFSRRNRHNYRPIVVYPAAILIVKKNAR